MPKVSGKPYHFSNILFGKIYNLFSANFSNFKFFTGGTSEGYSNNKTLRINAVETGCVVQGIFGGHGVFGSHGDRDCVGHGRGQGRGIPYTPYRPPSAHNNIKIEAFQYPKEEFR